MSGCPVQPSATTSVPDICSGLATACVHPAKEVEESEDEKSDSDPEKLLHSRLNLHIQASTTLGKAEEPCHRLSALNKPSILKMKIEPIRSPDSEMCLYCDCLHRKELHLLGGKATLLCPGDGKPTDVRASTEGTYGSWTQLTDAGIQRNRKQDGSHYTSAEKQERFQLTQVRNADEFSILPSHFTYFPHSLPTPPAFHGTEVPKNATISGASHSETNRNQSLDYSEIEREKKRASYISDIENHRVSLRNLTLEVYEGQQRVDRDYGFIYQSQFLDQL
ncbi:hypothetical protein STEG23_028518, partial [Scotinomys teguina]